MDHIYNIFNQSISLILIGLCYLSVAIIHAENCPQSFMKGNDCIKPNIVMIVADDMGWNDAGWNNQDIKTPTLVSLAKTGIRFNDMYLTPLCTPSRAALMTGMYSFNTGMQHSVIDSSIPVGLPLKYPTLANMLKEQNYATHAIGKWNLGFCHWEYTPTYRGFDSFFGFYQPVERYYSHMTYYNATDVNQSMAYDFRNNTNVAWKYKGMHNSIPFGKQVENIMAKHAKTTPLFLYYASAYVHVPHEVPQIYEDIYINSTVKNIYRRKFMARVSALDDEVRVIVEALQKNGLYENTIIVFTSDNGGHPLSGGNNYPFRGGKRSSYEGGIRVPSFIHSPLLKITDFTYHGIMHGIDWYSTFNYISGGQPDANVDSVNMWEAITFNLPSPRTVVVPTIDNYKGRIRAVIRENEWKLILGDAGDINQVYTPEEVKGTFFNDFYEPELYETQTTDKQPVLLFNLRDDPSESVDLSAKRPEIVKHLKVLLDDYISKAAPPLYVDPVPEGDPRNFGDVYTPGWCEPIHDPWDTKCDI